MHTASETPRYDILLHTKILALIEVLKQSPSSTLASWASFLHQFKLPTSSCSLSLQSRQIPSLKLPHISSLHHLLRSVPRWTETNRQHIFRLARKPHCLKMLNQILLPLQQVQWYVYHPIQINPRSRKSNVCLQSIPGFGHRRFLESCWSGTNPMFCNERPSKISTQLLGLWSLQMHSPCSSQSWFFHNRKKHALISGML